MAWTNTITLHLNSAQVDKSEVYARRSSRRRSAGDFLDITLQDTDGTAILEITGDIDGIKNFARALEDATTVAELAKKKRKSRWEISFHKEVNA